MKILTGKEAFAYSRYVRMSPYKLRRILDYIRGRNYYEASLILNYLSNRSCNLILKVLKSAVSNIKQVGNDLVDDKLILISETWVDEAPSFKRIRPRAQGRGFKIRKRMSHIVILI